MHKAKTLGDCALTGAVKQSLRGTADHNCVAGKASWAETLFLSASSQKEASGSCHLSSFLSRQYTDCTILAAASIFCVVLRGLTSRPSAIDEMNELLRMNDA